MIQVPIRLMMNGLPDYKNTTFETTLTLGLVYKVSTFLHGVSQIHVFNSSIVF